MLLFVLMYIICFSGIDYQNDFCYFYSDDIEEEGKGESEGERVIFTNNLIITFKHIHTHIDTHIQKQTMTQTQT